MPTSADRAAVHLEPGPRRRTFALSWLSYAVYYLARKNFAVVKAQLEDRYHLGRGVLGAIDTVYLVAYAVGQFTAGWAGDRIGARRLVGFGMLGCAAASFIFASGASAWVFGIAFGINGVLQATGWPGNVKAMAGQFQSHERGTVMGIWTTNYQVGGLVATALATALLVYGWQASFIVPGAIVAVVGLVYLWFLPPPALALTSAPAAQSVLRGRDLLRMPIFWSIGTAYFCLKLIRYSILFWLPYFLRRELHYTDSQAGYLSISFEAGGIVGAIAVGIISDRYFPTRRRTLASGFILALAFALLFYSRVAAIGPFANFGAMALVGFCLFGPDALISGAAAQDLGGPHGSAKAAGFINGIGSIGGIVQGGLTAGVSAALGWGALYDLFVVLAVVAAVLLYLSARAKPASVATQ